MKFRTLELPESAEHNCRLLARYLWVENPIESFDMNSYCRASRDSSPGRFGLEIRHAFECGTVGCAIGNGPRAGIPPGECKTWNRYADKFVGFSRGSCNATYRWCFHDRWSFFDNTPRGAAQRIWWMLRNGQIPLLESDFAFWYPLIEPDHLELYQGLVPTPGELLQPIVELPAENLSVPPVSLVEAL